MQNENVLTLRRALGAVIRFEREGNGWDQEAFARLVGLHPSAISRIESGRRAVTFDELVTFSRVFGVLPGYLFTRVDGLVSREPG